MSSPVRAWCVVWSLFNVVHGQITEDRWTWGLKETTHRQSNLVCQSLHTPDQSSTGIAWDLWMAKGDVLQPGTHLLTTPATVLLFLTISYKRNQTHIFLTFDWPPSLSKTKEGKKLFSLHFHGLACHDPEATRIIFQKLITVLDQQQESRIGLNWQMSSFLASAQTFNIGVFISRAKLYYKIRWFFSPKSS